jgi:NitT/TauT family transport system substrate-binding protein
MKSIAVWTTLVLALGAPAAASADTVRIAIGTQDTTVNTVHAGLIIRELKLLEKYLPRTGKYANTEFEVIWKNFTSGPPLTGEMIGGKLDIGSLGDFPSVLNAVAFEQQGSRSVYVATLSQSAIGAGNGLVVPVDSPVQTLSDLKGKQISVPFGSAAHGMVLRAIRDLGWDPERDVSLVSQAPEVGGTSLKAHKIDAHADFVPFAELFPFRGFARKIYDGSSVNTPTSHGVVARGDFARQYPELVVAFLKAMIEADKRLAAEPEKYAELVEKVAGVDAEVVYMFHGPLGIQTRDFSIKPETRKSLEVAFDTLKLLKRAEGTLDVNAWIDDRYIRQAAKESGLDYDVRLHSYEPIPLLGKDARSGDPIADRKQAAQVWLERESKVRPYATVASALAAVNELEQAKQAVRVVLVHDAQTGLALFADKAWYVLDKAPGAPNRGPSLSAYLTKTAAARAAEQSHGSVTSYAAARAALKPVATGAKADATGSGTRANL